MRQTDVGPDPQPFIYTIVQVCTCRIAFETLDRKDTFIVQVTGRYKIVGFFILTAEVYRIFLTQTGFQQSVSPISPIIQFRIGVHLTIRPDRHVDTIRIITEFAHHIIRRIGTGIFIPIPRIQIAIIQSTPSQLRQLIRRQLIRQSYSQTGEPPSRTEIDLAFFAGALAGRDHHDAIGCTRAVQGGGRSIFQDGHGLDIVRVDRIQITVVGCSVDHIKRRTGSVHGPDAADHNRRVGPRLTGIVDNLHTTALPLQSLSHVGSLDFFQRFFLDYAGRTRKGRFLARTIGDNHHLVDCHHVRFHFDLHAATGDDDLFRLIAQIRKMECFCTGRDNHRKLPFLVGGYAVHRLLVYHSHTDHRQTVFGRNHNTRHSLFLCHQQMSP